MKLVAMDKQVAEVRKTDRIWMRRIFDTFYSFRQDIILDYFIKQAYITS
jgi:hypothetical protein